MEQKTTLAFPTHHSTLVVSSSTSPGRPGGEICPWTLGSGSTSLCKKRQKTNNQIGSSSQYFYVFFLGSLIILAYEIIPPKKLGKFFHPPKKPEKTNRKRGPPRISNLQKLMPALRRIPLGGHPTYRSSNWE